MVSPFFPLVDSLYKIIGRSLFWPFNYCPDSAFDRATVEPKILTIELSTLNKFDHLAGFKSYLYFLKVIKTSYYQKVQNEFILNQKKY